MLEERGVRDAAKLGAGVLVGAVAVAQEFERHAQVAPLGRVQVPTPASTGRPKLYCSPACRKAAYEDRRAKRPGAVRVQLIEKVITEHLAHSEGDCVHTVLGHHGRVGEVIKGLETTLRTTPVPQLRSRWLEVDSYTRRLSRALDQAERRVAKYAREHPDWQA